MRKRHQYDSPHTWLADRLVEAFEHASHRVEDMRNQRHSQQEIVDPSTQARVRKHTADEHDHDGQEDGDYWGGNVLEPRRQVRLTLNASGFPDDEDGQWVDNIFLQARVQPPDDPV